MDHTVWLSRNELDAITETVWVLIAIAIGLVVHRVTYWLLSRWAERSHNWFAGSVVRRTCRPAAYVVPLLAILIAEQFLDLPAAWTNAIVHASGLLTIAGIGWTLIALIRLWSDVVVARHRTDVEDNLLARQLGTRVDILSRVGVTIVWRGSWSVSRRGRCSRTSSRVSSSRSRSRSASTTWSWSRRSSGASRRSTARTSSCGCGICAGSSCR
jgi:hypothetical protein